MTFQTFESAGRFFGVCKPSDHLRIVWGSATILIILVFQLPRIEANSLRSASATTSCGASTPDLTSSTVTPAATPPVAPVEASQHYVAWLKNINLPDLIMNFSQWDGSAFNYICQGWSCLRHIRLFFDLYLSSSYLFKGIETSHL